MGKLVVRIGGDRYTESTPLIIFFRRAAIFCKRLNFNRRRSKSAGQYASEEMANARSSSKDKGDESSAAICQEA
jgi:hypothetical protein